MGYLLPAAIAAMLGYMLWSTAFRLRRDRLVTLRERTRGRFALRPKERLRMLLGRAFKPAPDTPEWEEPLLSRLAEVPRDEPREPRRRNAEPTDSR